MIYEIPQFAWFCVIPSTKVKFKLLVLSPEVLEFFFHLFDPEVTASFPIPWKFPFFLFPSSLFKCKDRTLFYVQTFFSLLLLLLLLLQEHYFSKFRVNTKHFCPFPFTSCWLLKGFRYWSKNYRTAARARMSQSGRLVSSQP